MKIYPFKTVEAGALVTSSIVWESKGARTLFGRRGVRGLANVDITSEVAVRLAMAYGTALKKGSVVCTSRDTSRVARALKRAIIAGLNLSGVHVMDLELSTVPVTRFQVRSERAQGGISVRLAPDDPDSVEIRFFDEKGADIDEAQQRKLERLLYREDFRRAFAADIGDIMFPPRALEFYTAALEASVDSERLRQRSFKVVLDYSFGAASVVMPHVLGKIGASVLAVNPYAATVGATVDDLETRVKIMGDLVRTSGSDLGLVFDPDGETAVIIDDEGTALTADQALLVIVELVCATQPERADRAAGVGEPRGRAHRRATRRDGHLDEAVGRAPHGGRAAARHRSRGVAGGRLHLAVVPARVRRGGDAGAPARPARARRAVAVGDPRRRAGVAHRARSRARRRGSARARSCARWSSGRRTTRRCSSTA